MVLGPALAFWSSFVTVDAFLPSGAIANQVPFTPWPLVSPAAWSPENRYGGHVVWQPPVHVVVGGLGESLSNRYSVRPSLSVTIMPSGELLAVSCTVCGADRLPSGIEAAGGAGVLD